MLPLSPLLSKVASPLPLPPRFHPISPKLTQCHPTGVPGKPGFGLLGWKVTQPGVPGKGRFWLARVEAARPALPKYQVLMTKYRSYVKELFTSRPEALSP